MPHWARHLRGIRLVLAPYRQGGLHVIHERKTDPGIAVGRKEARENVKARAAILSFFKWLYLKHHQFVIGMAFVRRDDSQVT